MQQGWRYAGSFHALRYSDVKYAVNVIINAQRNMWSRANEPIMGVFIRGYGLIELSAVNCYELALLTDWCSDEI
jgi:hypothetical protein